jgi:hypothetical protein
MMGSYNIVIKKHKCFLYVVEKDMIVEFPFPVKEDFTVEDDFEFTVRDENKNKLHAVLSLVIYLECNLSNENGVEFEEGFNLILN